MSSEQVRLALLARQGLLTPHRAPVPDVLERIGGIQAQHAPAMYVGLWSRAAGITRADVDRRLVRSSIVQATLLRTTIHLVSRGDFWTFAIASREERRRGWLAAHRGQTAEQLELAAERVRHELGGGATLSRRALDLLVGKDLALGVGQWVELVRVPPSGTWDRPRADLFGLAEDRVGPPPPDLDAAAAIVGLVRRYLRGFGPATRQDVASFCGLPQRAVGPALDALEPLRRFRAEDGGELLDLPRAPLPPAGTPVPVRFLPTWDATLLVHARRTLVLPERFRPTIFTTKRPRSMATFLVDGQVRGAWHREAPEGVGARHREGVGARHREGVGARHREGVGARHREGGRVVLEPFEPLPREVLRRVQEAAEPLAAFCA